jgi:uncharacterized repeat protein (TIGR01451 family)
MSTGRHQARATGARGLIFGASLAVALGMAQLAPIAAAAGAADSPGPPSADGVQPVIADTQSSNDDCGQLGFDHGVSIAGNGQVSSGTLTVTVSGYNSPTGFVDWSSNRPIDGVYVKGGPSGGNLFSYPAGDTGDQDLHTPRKADGGYYNVSHLAFCWNDTDVPGAPDVTVEKSNDPAATVAAGDEITYALAVTNDGDSTATGVVVTDDLPNGVSFVSASQGCSEAGGTVTCAIGDLAAGETADVEITVSVDAETCGAIENVAEVSASNEGDGAAGNNGSNEVTNTVDCDEPSPPDLQVTKTSDAGGGLQEGDAITYTITVTNVGDSTAQGVELDDTFPRGMGVDASPFPMLKGEPCVLASSTTPGGVNQATMSCGPVSLEAGESATVTVTSTGAPCGPNTNRVDVEAGNEPAELVGPENHDQVTDVVECELNPGIAIDKTASPTSGPAGTTIVYTYEVTNTGDTALFDIVVTDDKLGTIGHIESLAVGASRRLTATFTLGSAPVTNVATAVGVDGAGNQVSAQDSVTVDVVSAGGGTGGDGGGTPFTGAETGGLAVLALGLSTLGAALVALSGRRRRVAP